LKILNTSSNILNKSCKFENIKYYYENNILSIMEKEFKPNHVSSILKKGKIRENRNTRTFNPKIDNIELEIN
jgi:hypothetical protein